MTNEFRFSPKVVAVLGQIGLVREVRSISRARGPLSDEIKGLIDHLRRELRRVVPGMGKWKVERPYEDHGGYYLEAFKDSGWKCSESEGITFGICIKCDPTIRASDKGESPFDEDPYVFVYVPLEWPSRDNLVKRLKSSIPQGFTDDYSPGDPDEENPLWRYLPLEDFTHEGDFDTGRLIQEISKSFESLVSLCPIIDDAVSPRETPR